MPYALRRTRKVRPLKRRPIRRRRFYRRRLRPTRPVGLSRGQQVVACKRFSDQIWCYGQKIHTAASTNPSLAKSDLVGTASTELNSWLLGARLEDVPNDSEFTSLFRYFKISGVAITFILRGNVTPIDGSGFSGASGASLPVLFTSWAPDMDYTSMPTSLQVARQRANLKKHYFNNATRTCTVFIRPKLMAVTADHVGGTYTASGKSSYLSCANDKTALHSGLWVNLDLSHSSVAVGLDLEMKYYFTFRGMQ